MLCKINTNLSGEYNISLHKIKINSSTCVIVRRNIARRLLKCKSCICFSDETKVTCIKKRVTGAYVKFQEIKDTGAQVHLISERKMTTRMSRVRGILYWNKKIRKKNNTEESWQRGILAPRISLRIFEFYRG